MEKGIEAKTIVQLYHEKCEKLQAESDSYKKETAEEIKDLHFQINKLTRKNSKLTAKNEMLELQLKTQQEFVIKPLRENVQKLEEWREKHRNDQVDLKKYLKILLAMLRSPRMCDQFFKYEKRS